METEVVTVPPAPVVVMVPLTEQVVPATIAPVVGVSVTTIVPPVRALAAVNVTGVVLHANVSLEPSLVVAFVTAKVYATVVLADTLVAPAAGAAEDSDAVGAGVVGVVVGGAELPDEPPPPPPHAEVSATMTHCNTMSLIFMAFSLSLPRVKKKGMAGVCAGA